MLDATQTTAAIISAATFSGPEVFPKNRKIRQVIKSVATVCNEIYVEMRKMARHFDQGQVMLRVHPEVAKALKENTGRWLVEMEEMIGRTIIVKSDPAQHQEQFDIN